MICFGFGEPVVDLIKIDLDPRMQTTVKMEPARDMVDIVVGKSGSTKVLKN